jgi:peptidoglycan/LPS O-acetylase OafA/YrhL
MSPRFSVYLDVVRFLCALAVFLGHAAGLDWTGGFLWPLHKYGDTCVVVFFLLSGFVIAYVSDVKERDWRTYAVHRIARLWSVVLPALLLTFVIDYIGVRVAPEIYIGRPWFHGDDLALRYLASLLMLQSAWTIDYVPGINAPFWSLSYEAFYYLAFALILFAKRWRWYLLPLVFLVAGPVVTGLFPLWLLGVAAYRMMKARQVALGVAAALFLAGAAVLVVSPWLRDQPALAMLNNRFFWRYVDAAGFMMNLVGAGSLLQRGAAYPASIVYWTKKISATTFPLYLFHRPLIQFFCYVGPENPSSWGRRALVILGTLVVVLLLMPVTEWLQKALRNALAAPAVKKPAPAETLADPLASPDQIRSA